MFKAVNMFFNSAPALSIKAGIRHAPQKEKKCIHSHEIIKLCDNHSSHLRTIFNRHAVELLKCPSTDEWAEKIWCLYMYHFIEH